MQNVGHVPVAHACNPSYSEAEIRRIKVQSQPRQKIVRPHFRNKLDIVVHIYGSSYPKGGGRRIIV
jgi:hypothetical protein